MKRFFTWHEDLEPQADVTEQLLGYPDGNVGDKLPTRPTFDADHYIRTFTPSQLRAYRWVSTKLDEHQQVRAAIIGPAGTGKLYLLNGLISCTVLFPPYLPLLV